ncbi:MAG: response regulator [Solirubrobacteraceae bacterium]
MIETLIVEDDYHVSSIHAAYVKRVAGFSVVGHAATLATAVAEIARLRPALVLLDLYLPDGHGLDLVHRSDHGPAPPDFLVISAARDMASVRRAMQLGTVHYLVKPFTFAQLEERLIAYQNLHRRLARLDEAEQNEVDALYGLLRGPAPLAKGVSAPTMNLIRELLTDAAEDVSAAAIAERIGISRSTAQRYLATLVRQGDVELRLHYGSTGRPEHRYSVKAG